MTVTEIDTTLAMAKQKLRHSADNGEYSAMIKPHECEALLDHIAELEDRGKVVVLPQRGWSVKA